MTSQHLDDDKQACRPIGHEMSQIEAPSQSFQTFKELESCLLDQLYYLRRVSQICSDDDHRPLRDLRLRLLRQFVQLRSLRIENNVSIQEINKCCISETVNYTTAIENVRLEPHDLELSLGGYVPPTMTSSPSHPLSPLALTLSGLRTVRPYATVSWNFPPGNKMTFTSTTLDMVDHHQTSSCTTLLPMERSSRFQLFVRATTLTLQVYHYRLLREPLFLGQTQIDLDPLLSRSIVGDRYELYDRQYRPTASFIHVRLSIRSPLQFPELVQRQRTFLLFHFPPQTACDLRALTASIDSDTHIHTFASIDAHPSMTSIDLLSLHYHLLSSFLRSANDMLSDDHLPPHLLLIPHRNVTVSMFLLANLSLLLNNDMNSLFPQEKSDTEDEPVESTTVHTPSLSQTLPFSSSPSNITPTTIQDSVAMATTQPPTLPGNVLERVAFERRASLADRPVAARRSDSRAVGALFDRAPTKKPRDLEANREGGSIALSLSNLSLLEATREKQ